MTFTGVYVPLITPFDATGAVDLEALEALARQVLTGGGEGQFAKRSPMRRWVAASGWSSSGSGSSAWSASPYRSRPSR
jgi:hypothetical protein